MKTDTDIERQERKTEPNQKDRNNNNKEQISAEPAPRNSTSLKPMQEKERPMQRYSYDDNGSGYKGL